MFILPFTGVKAFMPFLIPSEQILADLAAQIAARQLSTIKRAGELMEKTIFSSLTLAVNWVESVRVLTFVDPISEPVPEPKKSRF